jgi:hypothetical protein
MGEKAMKADRDAQASQEVHGQQESDGAPITSPPPKRDDSGHQTQKWQDYRREREQSRGQGTTFGQFRGFAQGSVGERDFGIIGHAFSTLRNGGYHSDQDKPRLDLGPHKRRWGGPEQWSQRAWFDFKKCNKEGSGRGGLVHF